MSVGHRLREARIRRGFDTALSAARAFGWNFNTYAAHENGNRGVTQNAAEKYARALRVSPAWLLMGLQDNAFDTVPVRGIIGEDGLVTPPKKNERQTAPAAINTTEKTVALVVKGRALGPSADDGWIYYYEDVASPPTLSSHGRLCLVETTSGVQMIRKIFPGRKPGTFDLHSLTGGVSLDVELRSAAVISWIRPKV